MSKKEVIKFYVHVEDRAPKWTGIIKWPTEQALSRSGLAEEIARRYNRKHGATRTVDAGRLELQTDQKGTLDSERALTRYVKAGCDVFAVEGEARAQAKGEAEDARANTKAKPSKEKARTKEGRSGVGGVQALLAMAQGHVEKGQFRQAMKAYEAVVEAEADNIVANFRMGLIWMDAGKYKRAETVLGAMWQRSKKEAEVGMRLAECYAKLGKLEEAQATYMAVAEDEKLVAQVGGERVQVEMARLLMQAGQDVTAAKLAAQVMQVNENNVDACQVYAGVLLRQGATQDALRVYLRSLLLKPQDEAVRKDLALAVNGKQGVQMLLAEMEGGSGSLASAFAYLGLICKEHGQMEESVQLYARSVEEEPLNASYVLNYVHVLEIVNRYQEAFETMVAFVRRAAEARLYVDGAAGPLRMATVLALVGDIDNVHVAVDEVQRVDDLEEKVGEGDVRVGQGKEDGAEGNSSSVAAELNSSSNSSSSTSSSGSKVIGNPTRFNEEELDVLAIVFTCIKVLYVRGNMNRLKALVNVAEAAKGKEKLHLTSVRNEHAYYCCIAQLLETMEVPVDTLERVTSAARAVYVCGDSHTLATAWREVEVCGEKRVLVPKLVTGLKAWHLRDESIFYPKRNYEYVSKTIPDGADVVFLFGEIDCREGFLVAVEKCRYESVEEASEVAIDIYVRKMEELEKTKQARVFVHPIVPVLKETRAVVRVFNGLLHKRIAAHPTLRWLDFFDALLDEEGQLHKEFELDGTHLHPAYLLHLGAAMERVETRE